MDNEIYEKLRDLFTLQRNHREVEAKAYTEFLTFLGKYVLKEWDPQKVSWVQTEGYKGIYEKATEEQNKGNSDFQVMIQDLKKHDGKLTREGLFYWLFDREVAVGRKKTR